MRPLGAATRWRGRWRNAAGMLGSVGILAIGGGLTGGAVTMPMDGGAVPMAGGEREVAAFAARLVANVERVVVGKRRAV